MSYPPRPQIPIYGLALSLSLTVAASMAGPADAAQVYELQLAPRADAADLLFDGWLGSPGDSYTIDRPPQFGFLVGETYVPSPEFWWAGGDSFDVAVQPPWPGVQVIRTVLLTAARPTEVASGWDFEASGLLAPVSQTGWTLTGDHWLASIVHPGLSGSHAALRVDVQHRSSVALSYDPLGNGENSVGGLGDVDLPPPFGNPGDTFALLGTGGLRLTGSGDQLRVTARVETGLGWSLAASVPECALLDCSTPWLPVAPGPAHLDVWGGPKVLGHPNPMPTSIRLTLTQNGSTTTEWVDHAGVDPAQSIHFGSIDPTGHFPPGTIFDDVEVRHGYTQVVPRAHLAADFEGGSIGGGWNQVGPSSIASSNHSLSPTALEIDLPEAAAGGAYLVDVTPYRAETLGASFLLDVTGLNLVDGESMTVWSAASSDSPSVGRHVTLKLQRSGGEYRLRGRALDDASALHKTPWVVIEKGVGRVALAWRAGDGDGFLRLFVDGELAGERANIANKNRRIESVLYGVTSVSLAHTGASSTAGTVQLDDLLSFE